MCFKKEELSRIAPYFSYRCLLLGTFFTYFRYQNFQPDSSSLSHYTLSETALTTNDIIIIYIYDNTVITTIQKAATAVSDETSQICCNQTKYVHLAVSTRESWSNQT